MAPGEPQSVEQRLEVTEPVVQVERTARGEPHEDDAGPFLGGQRHQPGAVALQRSERLLAGDPDEAARHVVGPGVVRAGDPLCSVRPANALGDQLGAPVAAGVHAGVHGTGGVTGDEDRDVDDLNGLVATGLGQLARHRQRQRDPPVDAVDLVTPAPRVRVVADGLTPLRRGLVGPVLLVEPDQPRHHRPRVPAHDIIGMAVQHGGVDGGGGGRGRRSRVRAGHRSDPVNTHIIFTGTPETSSVTIRVTMIRITSS